MSDPPTGGVPDRAAVLASYHEAVRAIGDISIGAMRWDAPTPCGEWTVLDLTGHLVAITRYWHRLLDGAIAGRPLANLPRGSELAAMNADDLARLPETEGADRMEQFADLAEVHLRRLDEVDWDLVLGSSSGLGELSVGQHTGVAIGEWHVHAWDLTRALSGDHRPYDVLTVARGQRVVFRATEAGDPWVAVLLGYGRDPDWHESPSA